MRINKTKKASITIYLSLIFVTVLLLISIIIESARMNMVQSECKTFTYLATDSVLAGYARQVYEDYGVLMFWENESVNENLKKYIQANIELGDVEHKGSNLLMTRLKNIKAKEKKYVWSNGEEEFVREVSNYMKYAVATEAIDKVINISANKSDDHSNSNISGNNSNSNSNKINGTGNNNGKNDSTDSNSNGKNDSADSNSNGGVGSGEYNLGDVDEIIDDSKSKEIQENVEKICDEIKNLKDADIQKKLKTKKKREMFLEKIMSIEEDIKLYQKDKKEFLSELNKDGQNKDNQNSMKDFMDDNLNILKSIEKQLTEEINRLPENSKEQWETIAKDIESKISSLQINEISEEDKKNKGIYESAKGLIEKGILSLVIDETDKISSTTVELKDLPSTIDNKGENSLDNVKTKAALVLYGAMKFGNFTNLIKNREISYELEYIVAGKDSDRSNLASTVEQIVAVRNVVTLAYLVTDKEKMALIETTAASAATAIGLPFLEPVIKGVLLEGWALAEAINDVKTLLKGKKIDLMKNANNWKTSLKNLLASGSSESKNKAAIDYKQFCMILIMKNSIETTAYRIMDLIQLNVRKNYNQQFDMKKCVTSLDVEAQYESEPLFVAMPWVINGLNGNIGSYNFSIESQLEY